MEADNFIEISAWDSKTSEKFEFVNPLLTFAIAADRIRGNSAKRFLTL